MHSYSINFHQHPDIGEVGSQARTSRYRKEALKEGRLGRGTRKGFLEEEVCEVFVSGRLGKEWKEQTHGQMSWGTQPPKEKHTSEAATHRHTCVEGALSPLFLVFGSMVTELKGSMSTKPLCWACYCQG